jgi:hypothetical protein
MKRLVTYITVGLLAFALGVAAHKAFGLTNVRDNQTSAESREAEEYAVYSSIINSFRKGDRGNLLVIENVTSAFFPDGDKRSKREYLREFTPPEVADDTLDNYIDVNAQPRQLGPLFTLKNPYVLISKEESDSYFGDSPGLSERFSIKYPNSAEHITRLSRVGFNSRMDEAVVHIRDTCGWDCGGGGFVQLTKEKGAWKINKARYAIF